MAQVKPMLGEIELQLLQQLEVDGSQVLAEHSVPALEGDFLQGLGRRAACIALSGVLTGIDAGKGLKDLREKFRSAEPVSFVADINTATKVDKVIIEEMEIIELAGKPERFEYAFTLREYTPLPPAASEVPPQPDVPKPPDDNIDKKVGTLKVEVIVEGQPEFDYSHVVVTVEGTQQDGTALSRTLTNRTATIWNEEEFPAGDYTVKAFANSQPMSGFTKASVQSGQSANSSINLKPTSNLARTFLVHFRFNSAFVDPSMQPVLRQAAQHARDHSEEKLVIVGHTDKVGDPDSNQFLSERRARSVFAYLTFGFSAAARAESLAEWNAIRIKRPKGEKPSIKDSWGTREYQHMLQDLGFYPGTVDGDHGKLTDDAVRAYRCHKGLPAGTDVDDDVWQALIEDYLAQDKLAVNSSQFFTNCPNEILKWLGCGEEDPRDRRESAFRPSRRVELLFVRTDKLPCKIPQPETFKLPTPGTVNSAWCIGTQTDKKHCCLVTPFLEPGKNKPQPCTSSPEGPWCRQPAEPGSITVKGSIQRELKDGTFQPAPNQTFVLTTPDGRFLANEQASGEPVPARTSAKDGTFSFDNMPLGFYGLEVITPKTSPALVRLDKQEADQKVKGPSVNKALRSNQDHLDVVIVKDPVLREIHLPVAVHLMTSLNFTSRDVRTCPDPSNTAKKINQSTTRKEEEIKTLFEGANSIWRQARIRFDLKDIVKETYAHPVEDPQARGSCEVNGDEFTFLLSKKSAYDGAVNVFFFKDFVGSNEAGMGISPESGASSSLPGGCAVADQIRATSLGVITVLPLNGEVSTHVLAHELGHYLNLGDLNDLPANADRLMLSKTPILTTGALVPTKQTLTLDEVGRSRASLAATDNCIPLSLSVSGATPIGGTLSDKFIVVQNPGGVVTVEAQIPERLLDPSRGTLTMTGGNPGGNDRQRTVSADPSIAPAETPVVATYTPAGNGKPVISTVSIRAVTFNLRVDGAKLTTPGSTTFVATRDAATAVVITAEINPAPFCIPANLVVWSGGTEVPDPLRRTVSRAAIAQTVVSATMAGVKRTVTIRVIEVALTSNAAPFDGKIATVRIEGVLNSNLKSFDLADVLAAQRGSLFRARADIPGIIPRIKDDTIQASLIRKPLGGAAIEAHPVTLNRDRDDSDRFVSLPILAVPTAIGGEIVFTATKDIETFSARASETISLVVDGDFAGLAQDQATVRGMVIFVFAQAFKGSDVSTAAVRRHIPRANRAWAQAGLEVKERQVNDSVALPVGLLEELDQHNPFDGILTDMEKILLGITRPGNPVRSNTATDINIYYLKKLKRALATAYEHEHHNEVTDPGQSGIALSLADSMSQIENDTTLAHELGHLLLVGWGVGDEHKDPAGTVWPGPNVMNTPASDAIDLDRRQVENILQHVSAGDNPFIIFEP